MCPLLVFHFSMPYFTYAFLLLHYLHGKKIYLKKCSPWGAQSLPLLVSLTFLSSHLNFFPSSWFTHVKLLKFFTPPPSSHVQRFLRLQKITKIQTWGETWKYTNFGAPLSFTLVYSSLHLYSSSYFYQTPYFAWTWASHLPFLRLHIFL